MTSPATSSTVTQVSLSSTSTINALLGGSKWGGTVGSGVSISYSFPWQSGISSTFAGFNGSGSYSSLNEPNATQHYGLDATQIAAVQLALQTWGSIANISFNQVADNSTTVGDIRFAFTSATELTSTGQPAWGWAYFPTSNAPASGDIWLSSTATAATNPDWSIGSQNYSSMMHELGHALGLKHTFEGGVTLSLAEDTEQYSIMSYTSAAKSLYVKVTQSGGGWSWSSYHITPSTPMLYDMRAIQYLYGANTSYNTGDNTYTFDPAAPFIKTIWDAAGNDTISVSNFTLGCAIDLRQGHYSKISYFDDTSAPVTWSTPPPTPTFDGTDDLAIAFGCLIENATGGSGSDTLHGNDSDNTLNGGAGNDTLIGEGGNDNLIGGGGTDTVAYSGLRSQYVATALINGSYTVSGPNGVDTLSGITFVQFSDRTDTLSNLTLNVLPTGAVTINGNATQGQTLTASNSLADADGMGVVTYQWKAAGVAINGATASTLTLAEAQVGKAITVTASYTDGHGNAESLTSNATSLVVNINDNPTGGVTISGTTTQGQTLTAFNALSDADGMGVVTYQWLAAGVAISGATANTLTLAEAQVGKAIGVTASYTDGHGTVESISSNATGLVANFNDAPSGAVTISGSTTQSQTLTATNSLADADGMGVVSYQWKAAGIAIGGATASTLTLTEAQVGKVITVTASYTDGHGSAESMTSSATGLVANLNDAPTGGVTITGVTTQGQTLSAVSTLADLDGMGAITYQWKTDGIPIGSPTTRTLVLTEAQVGKVISVTASYADGHGTSESSTSSATAVVANLNDAPTGSITVTGTALQGQPLTATNSLVDLDGMGTIAYQWRVDGVLISSLATSTLVLTEAQVGKAISVTASYTDGHGTPESATSSATALVTNLNDAPTGGVTVAGTALQGQTLTVTNSLVDLDGLGAITYQWKANGTPIASATASTLVLTEAQVGKAISATASYTDGHGTAESATSNASGLVANLNDAPTGSITVSGTALQGQSLSVVNNLADLDGLGTMSYQWRGNGDPITGGTGSTFKLTETQVGKAISVTSSYTDGHGTAESVSSAAGAAVANLNDLPTGEVTIAGTVAQGQTLSASNTVADLDGLGAMSYQWKANGSAIDNALSNTLILTEGQVGKFITITASYLDGHGTPESVTSAPTAVVINVNDAPTGTVTIAGTHTQGQTLSANSTLVDLDGLGTVFYQWKANDLSIADASSSSLVLTEAQVGKTISVTASYVDRRGTVERVTSAASTPVANLNDAPTGGVSISGTATQGQTLSASNTLADLDGLGAVTYQWNANETALVGATGNSLALTQALVGKTITATASYTDGHGALESKTSASSGSVANTNDAPTGKVLIAGTPTVGQTLTVTNTLADADGLGTLGYQWAANGIAIEGATASTFNLSENQLGKTLTVTVSYTDGFGTLESVSTGPTASIASIPAQNRTGTPANDMFTGGLGNDAIDGLAGLDTAIYTARMAAYTISPTSISGPDGSDTLTSIERLQFLDANLAFDLDGNAGQTYRLYQASFNRTPDLAGLGGWVAAMDNGTTPVQVATSFMASAEFQSLYGANPSNEQFVSLLFTNALHRTADAGGLAYWVNQLTSGLQTRAQALVNLSESAENKASILPAISNGIVYATATQAAGPAKGQTFNGTIGDDSLIGSVGNDTFSTGAGNDTIIAGFGNDTITGGIGNDTVNGGGGLDKAIYSGNRAMYTVANITGTLTVSSGTDGTDILTNVERLKFDDSILAFDTSGNAGQTYRLYQAAFNRTPDKAGLSGWINGVDSGLSMLKVAAAFIESGEFKTLYGNSPSDSAFVNLLYTNALHRTADAGGLEYWLNQLSSHSQTREQALLGFSESTENQVSLIGVIQNGIELAVD